MPSNRPSWSRVRGSCRIPPSRWRPSASIGGEAPFSSCTDRSEFSTVTVPPVTRDVAGDLAAVDRDRAARNGPAVGIGTRTRRSSRDHPGGDSDRLVHRVGVATCGHRVRAELLARLRRVHNGADGEQPAGAAFGTRRAPLPDDAAVIPSSHPCCRFQTRPVGARSASTVVGGHERNKRMPRIGRLDGVGGARSAADRRARRRRRRLRASRRTTIPLIGVARRTVAPRSRAHTERLAHNRAAIRTRRRSTSAGSEVGPDDIGGNCRHWSA